jgi:hypothetical protein
MSGEQAFSNKLSTLRHSPLSMASALLASEPYQGTREKTLASRRERERGCALYSIHPVEEMKFNHNIHVITTMAGLKHCIPQKKKKWVVSVESVKTEQEGMGVGELMSLVVCP